jgi:phosphotransferase system IIB component
MPAGDLNDYDHCTSRERLRLHKHSPVNAKAKPSLAALLNNDFPAIGFAI